MSSFIQTFEEQKKQKLIFMSPEEVSQSNEWVSYKSKYLETFVRLKVKLYLDTIT
jgi:hypothetical protein